MEDYQEWCVKRLLNFLFISLSSLLSVFNNRPNQSLQRRRAHFPIAWTADQPCNAKFLRRKENNS